MLENWNDGIMGLKEFLIIILFFHLLFPVFHYSIIPLFHVDRISQTPLKAA